MNIFISQNKLSGALEVIEAAEFFNAIKTGAPTQLLSRAYELSQDIIAGKKELKGELPLMRNVNATKKAEVSEWNGLMGFDVDIKDNPGEFYAGILNKIVAAGEGLGFQILFISKTPSGGARFFIATSGVDIQEYEYHYEIILNGIQEKTGLKLDGSTKNINRGFFVFFPAETSQVYYNPGAAPYMPAPNRKVRRAIKKALDKTIQKQGKNKNTMPSAPGLEFEGFDGEYFDKAVSETEASGSCFMEGGRHTFLTKLAGRLSMYGVKIEFAIEACINNYAGEGFSEKEITRIIQDIYKDNIINGTFGLRRRPKEAELDIEIVNLEINKYITELVGGDNEYLKQLYGEKTVVEVIAPTGSGKTTSFQKISEIGQAHYDLVLIAAPQKGIAKQTAEKFQLNAITEDLKGDERQEALQQSLIICTYNQLPIIIKRAKKLGKTVLSILDEAHCLSEEYRGAVMRNVLETLAYVERAMLFTATPNNLISKLAGVQKRVIIKRRHAQRKQIINNFILKGKRGLIMPTLLLDAVNRNSGVVAVYLNSGDMIRKCIMELTAGGELKQEEIGVYASLKLIKEHQLEVYSVNKEIEQDKVIPDGIKLIFFTRAAEYGIDVMNNNITECIVVDGKRNKLGADEIQQFTSRFRNLRVVPVTLISQQEGSGGGKVTLTQLYNEMKGKVEAQCEKLNQWLDEEFKGVIKEQYKVQRILFKEKELVYFSKKNQKYMVDYLAIAQVSTEEYVKSLTMDERLQIIAENYEFELLHERGAVVEEKDGVVTVKKNEIGNVLNETGALGELRTEALKRLLEIKEEYYETFGVGVHKFSTALLTVARQEYEYRLPEWLESRVWVNIEGVRYSIKEDLLAPHFFLGKPYDFVKEKTKDIWNQLKIEKILNEFFKYAVIEFNNALELAIYGEINKRTKEILNVFYIINLYREMVDRGVLRYDLLFAKTHAELFRVFLEILKNTPGVVSLEKVCADAGVEHSKSITRAVTTLFKSEIKRIRAGGEFKYVHNITGLKTVNEALKEHGVELTLEESVQDTIQQYISGYIFKIEQAKENIVAADDGAHFIKRTVVVNINAENYLHEEVPEMVLEAPF